MLSLDNYINTTCNSLKKKLLQTLELFPEGKGWGKDHIRVALVKAVEDSQKTPEQLIKHIKRCHWLHKESFYVDGGKEHIPITQVEKDFNKSLEK